MSKTNTDTAAFLAALLTPGSATGRGGNRDLYDSLLGSWDATVVDHLADGTDRRQSAEMHFTKVLEGRAVQDLWIAPARAERNGAPPAPGNRFGTTLRVYDPATDTWRVTWINPVTGAENRLTGRKEGEQIGQTGTHPEGRPMRWAFVEVRPDAFHWRGEISGDGGRSWICETEFFARRRSSAAAEPVAP